ncbi:MAG: polysaccharide biosynthesis C-terminal domain-containing protein, partial [Oscillospiraceae bacterium]
SMFLFGTYQGMVLTVINLIPALLSSVGTVCLPVITRTQAKGDRKALERQAHKLLCTTGAVSVPICMFTFFFSMDIIMVLFGTSPSQAVIGSHLIKLLIPCSALASFTFVFNAIFHAVEKSNWVLWVLLPSAAIKCALSFVLCQMPMVNIRGFAISTDVFYIVVFALSLMGLKNTGLAFPFFKALLLPSVIAYCMAVATQILSKALLMRLPIFLKTAINGTFFVLGYTILLILSGFIVDK